MPGAWDRLLLGTFSAPEVDQPPAQQPPKQQPVARSFDTNALGALVEETAAALGKPVEKVRGDAAARDVQQQRRASVGGLLDRLMTLFNPDVPRTGTELGDQHVPMLTSLMAKIPELPHHAKLQKDLQSSATALLHTIIDTVKDRLSHFDADALGGAAAKLAVSVRAHAHEPSKTGSAEAATRLPLPFGAGRRMMPKDKTSGRAIELTTLLLSKTQPRGLSDATFDQAAAAIVHHPNSVKTRPLLAQLQAKGTPEQLERLKDTLAGAEKPTPGDETARKIGDLVDTLVRDHGTPIEKLNDSKDLMKRAKVERLSFVSRAVRGLTRHFNPGTDFGPNFQVRKLDDTQLSSLQSFMAEIPKLGVHARHDKDQQMNATAIAQVTVDHCRENLAMDQADRLAESAAQLALSVKSHRHKQSWSKSWEAAKSKHVGQLEAGQGLAVPFAALQRQFSERKTSSRAMKMLNDLLGKAAPGPLRDATFDKAMEVVTTYPNSDKAKELTKRLAAVANGPQRERLVAALDSVGAQKLMPK
jgi:hypothetical protein